MPALSVIDLALFMLASRERPFNIGPLAMRVPPPGFKGNFADKRVARMLQVLDRPWTHLRASGFRVLLKPLRPGTR